MSYSLLKTGGGEEVYRSKSPKFGKTRCKNSQLRPFAEPSCLFLVITYGCPFKPATIKSKTVYSSLTKISLKLVLKSGKERKYWRVS